MNSDIVNNNFKKIEKFVSEPTIIGGNKIITSNLSYVQYNTNGTFTIDKNLTCDILVVGGGGSGGRTLGGGGGGGAVVYITNASISAGTYNVIVGEGGAQSTSINGNKGSNSSFAGIVAEGGGYSVSYGQTYGGGIGGSGGGAGASEVGVAVQSGGTIGTSSSLGGFIGTIYGNKGGSGLKRVSYLGGGGGGGAGSIGLDGNPNNNGAGGKGGDGILINITGNNYYWGAGGGGAHYNSSDNGINSRGGAGGLGGGGGGSSASGYYGSGGTRGLNNGTTPTGATGGSGGANTGSGGGGGGWVGSIGGAGGSGVVIIRYNNNMNKYSFINDNNGKIINPIIWYKFDDPSSFLNDISNIFINNNGATFDNTNYIKGNGSIKFIASSSQYAIIPNNFNWNAINALNGISFSWWSNNNNSTGLWGRIFDFGNKTSGNDGGSRYIMVARSGTSSSLRFEITNPTEFNYGYTNSSNYDTSDTNYFDGIWRHYVWTISSSGIWNIYVNNVKILDNVKKIAIQPMSGTIYNYLGKSLYNSDGYYDGNINDFRIYNIVLTQNNISKLYNPVIDTDNVSSDVDTPKPLTEDQELTKNLSEYFYVKIFNSDYIIKDVKKDGLLTSTTNTKNLDSRDPFYKIIKNEDREYINRGNYIVIMLDNDYILKKYTFEVNNINKAPSSWIIYGLTINDGKLIVLENGSAIREDYDIKTNKSDKTCIKFLLDNNIPAMLYLIVFKNNFEGTNDIDITRVILEEGKSKDQETSTGSGIKQKSNNNY